MSLTTLAEVKKYIGLSSPTAEQTALLQQMFDLTERLIREYVGYEIQDETLESSDDDGIGTYTEFLPGRPPPMVGASISGFDLGSTGFDDADSTRIFLRELPVRSITNVWVNTAAYGIDANFTSDFLKTQGSDYFLDNDGSGLCKSGIVYSNVNWPTVVRSVKIVYRAGYTDAELLKTPFPKAAILATAAAWQEALAMQGSQVGEGFGPITREQAATWQGYYDTASVANLAGMYNDLPMEVKRLLQKYRRYDM